MNAPHTPQAFHTETSAEGTEFVSVVCNATEACDRKLIVWTSGTTDRFGTPKPRPTEEPTDTVCAEHGFDRMLGRPLS